MTKGFPRVDMETWRKKVESELKGADFDRALRPESYEELSPSPLYSAENSGEPDGAAGSPPYRRGHRKSGASGVSWMLTQRQALADIDALENAVLDDQAGGATGVWLVFDRAARLGLDADDSASIEHAGVEGAPIHELSRLDQVLGGVDLAGTRIHLDCGANTLPAAALFLAICDLREEDAATVDLRLNADPVSALARDGEIPGSVTALTDEAASFAADVSVRLPRARTFTVSSEAWQEAGCSTAQEAGIALATAVHYLRAMESAGMSVEDAARQITFRVPMGRDLFMSIAKLRAFRTLWNLVLGTCGIDEPEAGEFHAVPSRRTLTRFDPWVNMLRATSQTLAGVVGGADEVTTPRYDDMQGSTWWPPSMEDFVYHNPPLMNSFERSGHVSSALGRRIARNTQTILGEESRIGEVADPAGGSYYVESLTDELAERAWKCFQDIETEGGIIAALRNGTLHEVAAKRLAAREGRLRRRRDAITGVSEYADLSQDKGEQIKGPGAAVEAARAGLVEHRQARGEHEDSPLRGLDDAVAAAAVGATLGEISSRLEGRGETECGDPLRRRRDADDFEELREFAQHLERQGRTPKMCLATIGRLADHVARSTFATNLFAAGGITCETAEGSATDILAAMRAQGAVGVCICGSDDGYQAEAEALVRELVDTLGPNVPVMLAGRPDKIGLELPPTVVPVYMGCDVIHILGGLLYLSEAGDEEARS